MSCRCPNWLASIESIAGRGLAGYLQPTKAGKARGVAQKRQQTGVAVMADLPVSTSTVFLIAAAFIYAVIWLASGALSRFAMILARVLPLMLIAPAMLYLFHEPLQRHAGREPPPVQAEDKASKPNGAPRTADAPPPVTAPLPPPTNAPAPPVDGSQPAPPPPPGNPIPVNPSTRASPPKDDVTRRLPAPAPATGAPTDWDVVPVFYGTDRKRIDGPKRVSYGAERARTLELGRSLVTVPKLHQVPNIERPFAIRIPYFQITIYEQAEDPKQHFTLQELKVLTREEFIALARERVGASAGFKDQAIVFVHGYNTPFDYALYRTAQMAYDLQFDGAAFLYSWPSGAGVTGYYYDRESSTQAEPYLREFLDLVVRESGAKSVSVIAHSMGNWPLLNVLRELGPSLPPEVRLNQIILAAPDVDRDVFANLASGIKQYGRGVTLYCSSNDRAMEAARRAWGGIPRAGDVPAEGPILVDGVDTIDITSTSTDYLALNHSIYAEKSALLNDIGLLLQTGERPPERRIPILLRINTPKGDYWRYPAMLR
jgi:esterase/lipase superfamily enzyme